MDFAGYTYVAAVMVLVQIAVIILLYKWKPVWVVYATLLSIFLKGQYIWLGFTMYAWQFAGLLGLLYLLTAQSNVTLRHGAALSWYRVSYKLFFIYSFLISVPLWFVFSAEGLGTSGTQISASRIMSQTIYHTFLIGLFGIGVWAGRFLTAVNFLHAVIMIATIVAYGAILQVLVVRVAGINIFPIIAPDGTVRSEYIRDLVFRASSFAGEPKHLGIIMSIGLTLCFLARLMRISIGRSLAIHKPMVMITALLLGLSTTGMVLTAICIGFAATVFISRLRKVDILVVGITLTFVIVQVLGAGDDFAAALLGQLDRIEFEIQDQSVISGLLNNPVFLVTGTGLGNIHLIAVDFLPPEFPLFRDRGYKANSGLWFIIGDSGLIGLFLLLTGQIFVIQSYLRMRKYLTALQRQEAITVLGILLITIVSFLFRFDVLLFLASGFAVTRLAILRTETLVRVHHRGSREGDLSNLSEGEA